MQKNINKSLPPTLLMSGRTIRLRRMVSFFGEGVLVTVAFFSVATVLAILYFVTRDTIPFFQAEGFHEFFTSTRWFPSREHPEFGAGSLFYGSLIVTLGAVLIAVPLGVFAAVGLSEILPFTLRQYVKPVIEILASIPSVAYGFFALVIFAPLLQGQGGILLSVGFVIITLPILLLIAALITGVIIRYLNTSGKMVVWLLLFILISGSGGYWIWKISLMISALQIDSGVNALNVAIILGIMALPTVVSVSEDSLQAVSKDIRMASYGLGATKTETIVKAVIPSAASGIFAASLLGTMRAIGETMVVWMASGNAAQIPTPWYDITSPVRTLTATIAGDMGEADHITGSSRYHVLFALAFCLLIFSFISNMVSEWIIKNNKRKLQGGK
ncbi:MAG: phosphate ABC transporter permease subunit PstC [Planctomycetes bacterium]|nr:phosphate ABC transporter permease subunit PstC [Planctomycetota bacterium]